MELVHFVYKLSYLVSFFQREHEAFAIPGNNIQSLGHEKSPAVKDDFKYIFEQDFKIEPVRFFRHGSEIYPLVGDYKLAVNGCVVYYLACISGFQNYFVWIKFDCHLNLFV